MVTLPSPATQVRVWDLDVELSEDDVLVMATDGLWEKVDNQHAGDILRTTFHSQSAHEPRRYAKKD